MKSNLILRKTNYPHGRFLETDSETGEPRLAKELLPKILITDPVVQAIKETCEKADIAELAANPRALPAPSRLDCRPCSESNSQVPNCWCDCGLSANRGGKLRRELSCKKLYNHSSKQDRLLTTN